MIRPVSFSIHRAGLTGLAFVSMLATGLAVLPAAAQEGMLDIERSRIGQSGEGDLIGPAIGSPIGSPVETEPDGAAEAAAPGFENLPMPVRRPAGLAVAGSGTINGASSGFAELNSPLPSDDAPAGDFGPQLPAIGSAAPDQTEAAPRPAPAPARAAPAPRASRQASREPVRDADPTSPTLSDILDREVIRVGTVLRAPYAMRDAQGAVIGHDVDIATALAFALGVELDLVVVTEDTIRAGLEKDAYDVAIAGLAVSPDRALVMNFTTPYAENGIQLVTTRKLARRRDTINAYSDIDISIGVTSGTLAERLAETNFPRATIRRFADAQQAQAAFLRGDLSAMVAPSPFPEVLATQTPREFALPLKAPLSRTAEAMAIAQGDPEFLAYLNAWIVSRTMDDFLAKTRSYWFEGTQWLPRLTKRPRVEGDDRTARR